MVLESHRKAREFMVSAKVLLKYWTMESKLDKDGSEEIEG